MSTLISSEETKLTFGKHKGKTITQVLQEDPGYLIWADQNVEFFKLDKRLYQLASVLNKDKPRKWPVNLHSKQSPELDGGYTENELPF